MRILLISDLHFSADISPAEYEKQHPGARASAASGPLLGFLPSERMEKMISVIEKEHETAPLDAVIIPGDLSIDDYPFRRLGINWCEKFKDLYLPRFPAPTFVIPGNHDSYPEEIWHGIFGKSRQFSTVLDGCLFLLADTYRDPAKSASGSPYTPLDLAWAKGEMEKHPGLPVFLVAHYFRPESESQDFLDFLAVNPRIVMLFMGHSHRFEVRRLPQEAGGKPLVDIGAFSYYTKPTNGVWDFDIFDPEWRWGYQILELTASEAATYHVFPAVTYRAHNGVFTFEQETTERITVPLCRGGESG